MAKAFMSDGKMQLDIIFVAMPYDIENIKQDLRTLAFPRREQS
jgi:hypothetical protein